jgi:multidrug efflux pump subunit AcrA (membrane-fusion protein)
VPESLQPLVKPGDTVTVETDSDETTGVVTLLRAATDAETGEIVIEAVVSPNGVLPDEIPGNTADVTVTIAGATGVLTVPSEAIASRLDGSYAVQLAGSDGSAQWVIVSIVGTVDQRAAIRGAGIEAGETVLEPA